MADQSPELLRNTPTDVVTSQAPQGGLSAGQIEAPFRDASALLGKFGEAAGDLAVPAAQRQAATDLANQKVVRNPDGTVGVLNPASAMILGDAGRTYSHAVQAGTSDQILASVRPDLAAIHAANPLDGDALGKANDAYLTKLQGTVGGMGVIGQEVMKSARDMGAQHQDSAVLAGATNSMENTKRAILSTVDDKKNALSALAATPGGPNKPEYDQAIKDYDDALGKLGSNPLFKLPAETLALQRKQFMGELKGIQLVSSVDRTFDRKGKAEAQQELSQLFQNPDISREQANLLYRQGMAHLEFRSSDQLAGQKAAGQAIEYLRVGLAKGTISPSDPTIAGLRKQAADAGYADGVNQIDALSKVYEAHNAVKALPAAQVPAALGVPSGGPARAGVGRVGGTTAPAYLSALASGDVQGALRASEGLRTSPYWDVNHLRTGYGSDTVTRADGAVETVGPNTRISPADADRDLARRTADYATGARNAIGPTWDGMAKSAQAALTSMAYNYGHVPDDVVRAAKTGDPAAIAAAITAHANDNGGANYARRIAEANAVSGQTGVGGTPAKSANGVPFSDADAAANPWLRSEYFRSLAETKHVREEAFSSYEAGAKEALKAGNMPTADTLTALAQLSTNDPSKGEKAAEVFGMATALKQSQTGGEGGAPLTAPQMQQATQDWFKASRDAPDHLHQVIATSAYNYFKEQEKHAAEHPLQDGAHRFNLGDVPTIDPGSAPQDVANALATRGVMAQHIGELNKTEAPPLLEKGDGQALQGVMQGQQGAQAIGAISQTLRPADMQRLAQEPAFRDALTGMSRSGDPAKMNAAYSMMDKLQTQNPLQFDANFKDGLKDLRAWQASLAFYPPDVAAKRLMAQYDPSQAQAIEQSKKVADEALKSLSPESVVSKFNTGIPFTPFGTTAQAPASTMSGVAALALKDDYAMNYKDGFAATGDPSMADKFAMEKLALKYAVSPVNGNRVTSYPPERYYPEVGGSRDWMSKQLDDAVAEHLGVLTARHYAGTTSQMSPGDIFLQTTPAQRAYAAPRALVPDQVTQADIAAGRPPSYQVIIQGPDGRFQAMAGQNGAASRFRFDPAPGLAKESSDLEAQRADVLTRPARVQAVEKMLRGGR